ncbi:MAG: DUF5719 family protein, partial [Actinomycetes bacterium]
MTARRSMLAAAVVAVLVLLTSLWGGRPDPVPGDVARPAIPVAGLPRDLSSTWFCASGAIGASVAASHTVFLSNPTPAAATVRLSAFGVGGRRAVQPATVGPATTLAVNVDEKFGAGSSVLVESNVAPLVVAHRLESGRLADQGACATSTSDRWYFPSQSTARGTGATLVLFNPFATDAGADVRVYLPDGVRNPRALNGIVVPAGSTRYVDLGESVQRRDEFAASVQLRSGRLVAETVQVLSGTNGPRGMRLQLGVPVTRDRWAFAGGFTGPGASERLVVVNPGAKAATVLVQATPYGGSSAPPEPFELEVPALRFTVLDLSRESRVPGVGYHALAVESDQPVAVGRTVTLTGPPGAPTAGVPTRPSLTHGTSIGTGTPVQATRWLAPAVRTGPQQRSVVLVYNTSAGIALVTVEALLGGRRVVVKGFDRLEVPSGDAVVVPIGPGGVPDGSTGVVVT